MVMASNTKYYMVGTILGCRHLGENFYVELNYRKEVDKKPLIGGRRLLWGWKRSEERKLSVGRTKTAGDDI